VKELKITCNLGEREQDATEFKKNHKEAFHRGRGYSKKSPQTVLGALKEKKNSVRGIKRTRLTRSTRTQKKRERAFGEKDILG